jgi:hypothetical protein
VSQQEKPHSPNSKENSNGKGGASKANLYEGLPEPDHIRNNNVSLPNPQPHSDNAPKGKIKQRPKEKNEEIRNKLSVESPLQESYGDPAKNVYLDGHEHIHQDNVTNGSNRQSVSDADNFINSPTVGEVQQRDVIQSAESMDLAKSKKLSVELPLEGSSEDPAKNVWPEGRVVDLAKTIKAVNAWKTSIAKFDLDKEVSRLEKLADADYSNKYKEGIMGRMFQGKGRHHLADQVEDHRQLEKHLFLEEKMAEKHLDLQAEFPNSQSLGNLNAMLEKQLGYWETNIKGNRSWWPFGRWDHTGNKIKGLINNVSDLKDKIEHMDSGFKSSLEKIRKGKNDLNKLEKWRYEFSNRQNLRSLGGNLTQDNFHEHYDLTRQDLKLLDNFLEKTRGNIKNPAKDKKTWNTFLAEAHADYQKKYGRSYLQALKSIVPRKNDFPEEDKKNFKNGSISAFLHNKIDERLREFKDEDFHPSSTIRSDYDRLDAALENLEKYEPQDQNWGTWLINHLRFRKDIGKSVERLETKTKDIKSEWEDMLDGYEEKKKGTGADSDDFKSRLNADLHGRMEYELANTATKMKKWPLRFMSHEQSPEERLFELKARVEQFKQASKPKTGSVVDLTLSENHDDINKIVCDLQSLEESMDNDLDGLPNATRLEKFFGNRKKRRSRLKRKVDKLHKEVTHLIQDIETKSKIKETEAKINKTTAKINSLKKNNPQIENEGWDQWNLKTWLDFHESTEGEESCLRTGMIDEIKKIFGFGQEAIDIFIEQAKLIHDGNQKGDFSELHKWQQKIIDNNQNIDKAKNQEKFNEIMGKFEELDNPINGQGDGRGNHEVERRGHELVRNFIISGLEGRLQELEEQHKVHGGVLGTSIASGTPTGTKPNGRSLEKLVENKGTVRPGLSRKNERSNKTVGIKKPSRKRSVTV